MKAETTKMMNEMVAAAKAGQEIRPMFWQPRQGISATVSAAITAAKKAGLLEVAGLDGAGKPYYRTPVKAATHTGSAAVN